MAIIKDSAIFKKILACVGGTGGKHETIAKKKALLIRFFIINIIIIT